MATSSGSIAQHKRAVHEGVNILVGDVTIWQLQRVVWLNTKELFMKE